ncbi:MAG: hypothetical protein RR101_14420 [Burkholderiaceae bacterium]
MKRNRLLEALQGAGMGVLLAAAPAMSLLSPPPAIAPTEVPPLRPRSSRSGAASLKRAAVKTRNKARHAR